jgi:hypothetical protein
LTAIEALAERFDALERVVKAVPTDQDLATALTNFSTVIVQAVTDAQTRTQTDIDALKAQIAAGGTVTQADLDAVAAAQASALAAIAAIDPAAPVPPPTP